MIFSILVTKMETQQLIQLLIHVHVGLGIAALAAGLLAIVSKKGQTLHKKAGLLFYYTMLTTALLALLISVMPQHENPFLFAIGIFSTFFILTGYRALRFKHPNPNLTADKWIATVMLITGLAMVLVPLLVYQKINVVLAVFGVLGVVFSVRDLKLYQHPEKLKPNWLKMHLGNMMGGYIAATTAFLVNVNVLPGIYGWFAPGLLGGIYITFWMRKLNR
jgi:uncharacterized membrane protein